MDLELGLFAGTTFNDDYSMHASTFLAVYVSDITKGAFRFYLLPTSFKLPTLTMICHFGHSNSSYYTTALLEHFQRLLDAHTTYYLPEGYGAVYYTTPFAIKSRLVGGVQKFFTGEGPYPYELWSRVCSSPCPFTESMYGWEINSINSVTVTQWITHDSRKGGTYYDDGVRANAYIAGLQWGQSSLMVNQMPASNFRVNLTNPNTGEFVVMELPIAFGGPKFGWSGPAMEQANRNPNPVRRTHELFSERLLRDSLAHRVSELHKRADASPEDLAAATNALIEISSTINRINADTNAAYQTIRRDGSKVFMGEGALPFIPSPRQRMEDVFRLEKALWPSKRINMEAQNKDFDEYLAREAANPHKAVRKSASSAVEKPVLAGDATQWTMGTSFVSTADNDFEALTAYHGRYRNTTVLRLRSFDTSATNTYWVSSLNGAINDQALYNLNDNLIIDVSNNGGGLVCLNYDTLSFLVKSWSTRYDFLHGEDTVFSEFDLRMSDLQNRLDSFGALNIYDAYNTTTGENLSWRYLIPTTRTIGGRTSSYSQVFNWNPCTFGEYVYPPAYNFDKIIVITDGRCGSSCAYFINQLRENNKIRVVSYGGIYGEPLATSSFAGGNVFTWDYMRAWTQSVPRNPFSSYVSWNFRQNYSPGKYPEIPRQMDRLEADWYLPLWDPLWRFYNADNYNISARFALYESVLPLFDETPAGLAREDPPTPITPPVNQPSEDPVDPSQPPSALPPSITLPPPFDRPSFAAPPTGSASLLQPYGFAIAALLVLIATL